MIAAAGLFAAAVLAEGVSLALSVHDLQRGAQILQDASIALGGSPAEWTPKRIDSSKVLATEAEPMLADAADRLQSNPLLNAFGLIPGISPQVTALKDLAASAVDGGRAFQDNLTIAQAYNADSAGSGPKGTRVVNLLKASEAPLADAHARLAPTVVRLEADLRGPLLPPLRTQLGHALDMLAPASTRVDGGLIAARYGPAAIGGEAQKTYLLLLENAAELRPAGGFAGAVGTITFDHGAPAGIDISDQGAINPKLKQRFDPPYPMSRYLIFYNNSLEIGDAGWDPNFPSTAKLSEAMFLSATGKAVDGTIAVDPYAIGEVIRLAGPIDVPGYGTFTADNLFPKLDHIVNVATGPGSGKQALPPIIHAILQRVLDLPLNRWAELLNVLGDQAQTRHLQVYLHDQLLASALDRTHANGEMLAGKDDYLMVTDGNVGATKGDYYCHKNLTVRVEAPASGISRHEVLLDYSMPLPINADDVALNPGGAYRDYVRVWVPETANLTSFQFSIDGKPNPIGGLDALGLEHGHRSFGVFFILERGHRAQVRIDYTVPLIPGSSYDLYVQKQAGVPSLPTRLELSYPGGGLVSAADLKRDIEFTHSW